MLAETIERIEPLDRAAMAAAQARLDSLTKPLGSLGRLEELAVQLAGVTGRVPPPVDQRTVYVFAADHGVAAEGVSAYPREVTAQMVANFVRGGAAINVLARQARAKLVVVDCGVAGDLEESPNLIARKIAHGTQNFMHAPAMTRIQAMRALEIGIAIVEPCNLVGIGEMGIANSTSAAAIVAAASGSSAAEVAGRGTGVDTKTLRHKIDIIDRALVLHAPPADDGLAILESVGGFEIGAMAGAMLAAAAARIPVLVDGFISTAAALIAVRLAPAVQTYLIAAHRSAEHGHALALEALELRPLLSLDMRLGEATGAVLAINLVEAAARILGEMATFDEARVSQRQAGVACLPLERRVAEHG